METYRQCIIAAHDGRGVLRTTTWLPSRYAIPGDTLRFESDPSGSFFSREWHVEEVGAEMTEEAAESKSHEFREWQRVLRNA